MSADSPDQLRDELKEAIARVREQIDIEERSGHYIGDGSITVGALAELRTELAQLEEALANL
jgi:hypothetical protein